MYYFIYSKAQYEKQSGSYAKIGKKLILGKISFEGANKEYTSITQNLELTQRNFSDTLVVGKFESLSDAQYTKPRYTALRGAVI